jgi:hypothetical protein
MKHRSSTANTDSKRNTDLWGATPCGVRFDRPNLTLPPSPIRQVSRRLEAPPVGRRRSQAALSVNPGNGTRRFRSGSCAVRCGDKGVFLFLRCCDATPKRRRRVCVVLEACIICTPPRALISVRDLLSHASCAGNMHARRFSPVDSDGVFGRRMHVGDESLVAQRSTPDPDYETRKSENRWVRRAGLLMCVADCSTRESTSRLDSSATGHRDR